MDDDNDEVWQEYVGAKMREIRLSQPQLTETQWKKQLEKFKKSFCNAVDKKAKEHNAVHIEKKKLHEDVTDLLNVAQNLGQKLYPEDPIWNVIREWMKS